MLYNIPSSTNTPETIILVNGEFPKGVLPLSIINNWIEGRGRLICCDGAVNKLQKYTDKMPDFVIGDLDSVDKELKEKLSDRIIHIKEQDTNDMTKATLFATKELKAKDITFLGISGGREDHFFSNMSLMVEFSNLANEIVAITDTGALRIIRNNDIIKTYKGQQISIFNFEKTPISTTNLKWELNDMVLKRLWSGSLNEAMSDEIQFSCSNPIMVYSLND